MLACARIGAIHSVVFGGFSPDALAGRIDGCKSKVVITADEGSARRHESATEDEYRCRRRDVAAGSSRRDRRASAPAARSHGSKAATSGTTRPSPRLSADCPPRRDERGGSAVHPLHLGLDRRSRRACCTPPAAISSMPSMTHQYVFDYHDGDIYWCTADVGWVTGHSYIVYGPLANGATTLMFEGVPNYPDRLPVLGGDRQAQGQHLLHRADRDPRVDAGRRRAGEEDLAARPCGCSARSASRSIRKPGNGIIASSATTAARSSTPGGRPKPAAF